MQDNQNTAQIKGLVLALDVGGSFVKSGLADADGLRTEFPPTPISAHADAASVIGAFAHVIVRGFDAAEDRVSAVGVAMPGPFDYARGVSLMRQKFAAIRGAALVPALRKAVPRLAEKTVWFRHDANAFLAGELWRGAAEGLTRALGVTLGTGIGVACFADGRFVNNELGSPAPDVSVWSRPYKNGIVEDAVSTRGLVARYRRARPGYPDEGGVKGIAEAARTGDADARAVFAELGRDLGTVLMPVCERFRPERIVFGGQIANAFDLFEAELVRILAQVPDCPAVVQSALGSRAALLGAARCGL